MTAEKKSRRATTDGERVNSLNLGVMLAHTERALAVITTFLSERTRSSVSTILQQQGFMRRQGNAAVEE